MTNRMERIYCQRKKDNDIKERSEEKQEKMMLYKKKATDKV